MEMNTDPFAPPEACAGKPPQECQQTMRSRKKSIISALVTVVLGIVVFVVFIVPVPYVVSAPGPTFDLNAPYNGQELITVQGTDPKTGQAVQTDDPSQGQLRMVTVSEYGSPGYSVTLWDLWRLTRDGVSEVNYYYDLYPEEIDADQVQSVSQAMMTASHSTSSVAALEKLGYTIPAVVTVNEVAEESDAYNRILPGDVIVSVTTPDKVVHPIQTASGIFSLTRQTPEKTPLTVTVRRDGKEESVDVITGPAPDGVGSRLGIFLDIQTTLPFDVNFNIEQVGGPSAGMMFALAIIDKLTEGDLTGGKIIAGTGTLSYDGRVGSIGGLPQKIYGAAEDGAQYFLAPSENCDEVTSIPHGIEVFRVDTLDEALKSVNAIRQNTTHNLRPCLAK